MDSIVLKIEQFGSVFRDRLSFLRRLIADETRLPDFKGRHLFTARLRIILFIATWLVFFVFFPAIWKVSPFIPLIFNVSFLVTSLCYLHVIRYNNILLSVVFLEIFADVVSQTVIIYIMGMDSWAPYLIYCLYIAAAGILSGYHVALSASIIVLFCYTLLFTSIRIGMVQPFIYPEHLAGIVNYYSIQPYLNVVFLPMALVMIVYSVRIANFFSKIKEQALERRNTQLTALNHIGATIRHVLKLKRVVDEVLKGVIQGLGFEVCILALLDAKTKTIRFYVPEGNYYTKRLEELLGMPFSKMRLPADVVNNSTAIAIRRNRVLVRNNFTEMLFGMDPGIPMQNSLRAQRILSFKKFVITPLVAEERVVGAIIGASKKPYVDEIVIDTLDNFANQAALAIESSQLIDALEQKNRELMEADKMKSEFLAIMSHELRTPLNAVLGYTEALRDQSLGALNDDQQLSINEVFQNGKNLLDLINNILDLAKIESGKMSLNLDDFDLLQEVNSVKTSLQPLLDKKSHTMTVHGLPKMPYAKADVMKVRQILTNLVGNAIKFTEPGGKIDVHVDYFENSERVVKKLFPLEDMSSEIIDSPSFMIRVCDNGIGIKEGDMKHIFELFRQVDSSHTRSHEGTGLGLALTQQLVKLHSGAISLKSQYGKGTEFRVLLPQYVLASS